MTPWLTVIGIGDDGLIGLSQAARDRIAEAELLAGGNRHQAMVTETRARRLTWEKGLREAVAEIARWRGRRVVVLATGDPMWFGGGANLAQSFAAEEMTVLPHPGAYSLAAARMVWSLADVETLTVHGRPIETLNLALRPDARLLVLSRDGETPAKVAALLTARGFGPSAIAVLEHLGGPQERRIDGIAGSWNHPRCADLNTLAIECRPGPEAVWWPRVPGLPDHAFASDGQLTKREIRAVTLAALPPLPHQLLWDVGAGSGSIAIEWLRLAPRYRLPDRSEARAFAIERAAERCALIARNAAALGVPQLEVIHGEAPEALADLPRPDQVFLGGGVTRPGLIEACWQALAAGGRLVANAVSLEGTARLIGFREANGGSLTRLAVARAEPVGAVAAFKPLMEVVQYVGEKNVDPKPGGRS